MGLNEVANFRNSSLVSLLYSEQTWILEIVAHLKSK